MTRVPYSDQYDPPAPVVPVHVTAPSGGAGVHVVALVDTGADLTVMPLAIVETLSLPIVSVTHIRGIAGEVKANVHALRLEVAGMSRLAEVVALGAEAILGRDVANNCVLELDGPRRVLHIGKRRRANRP